MKYEEQLVGVFKVFGWLDKHRWRQPVKKSDRFFHDVVESCELRSSQKILIHWLIYILNRGKRAEPLWNNMTSGAKALVKAYCGSDVKTASHVSKLVNKYKKVKKKNGKTANDNNDKISGFPADIESIRRTLILLLNYDKDIVHFITRRLAEWKSKYPREFLPRAAFSLFLLSYGNVGTLARKDDLVKDNSARLLDDIKKAKSILEDDAEFEKEFKQWYVSEKRWHKRLWAGLRDYKKSVRLATIFKEGIADSKNRRAWEGYFNRQLELPGDMWNLEFFKHCLKPIAEHVGIGHKGSAPKVVRGLWSKVRSQCPDTHPEQLDVTFDFTPRMCRQELCSFCIFGPNGAGALCNPKKGNLCPVALASCGYQVICKGRSSKCFVIEGAGKGACRGISQED